MGMFDSVIFNCSTCGHAIEEQSKAGPCYLACHSPGVVPVEIAHDIAGNEIQCPRCHARWMICAAPIQRTVPMFLLSRADAGILKLRKPEISDDDL